MAAVTSLLTFCVAKFGLAWDVGEIMALVSTVTAPFLIYIGAEGYSEAKAKEAMVNAVARKEFIETTLQSQIEKKDDIT